MTKNDYRELMISLLQHFQSDYEDAQDDFHEGVWQGLQMAIMKLNQSAFLTAEDREG